MVANSPYSAALRELCVRQRFGRPSRDYIGDLAADLDRICAARRTPDLQACAILAIRFASCALSAVVGGVIGYGIGSMF